MTVSGKKSARSPRAMAVVLAWGLTMLTTLVVCPVFIVVLHFEWASWQSVLPWIVAWGLLSINLVFFVALRQIHWLERRLKESGGDNR